MPNVIKIDPYNVELQYNAIQYNTMWVFSAPIHETRPGGITMVIKCVQNKNWVKNCNSTVSWDRNATGSSEFSVIV